jgi:glutamyl-tRNA reductase
MPARWALAAAVPAAAASQQAFVGTGGFLAPGQPVRSPAQPVQASSAAEATHSEGPSAAQAVLAAGAVGLAARLADGLRKSQRRRLAGGLRAVAIEKSSSEEIVPGSDDVETSIAEFVPKISMLQNQAELLRSGELQEVIQTMKTLRKTELRGVFSEVDQLLVALIDAIDGLKDSALTIRKSELREHFDGDSVDSRDWVNQLEEDAANSAGDQSATDVETMMEVHVVGLSHHKATVDVRERLAVPEAEWNKHASELIEFARTANGYVVPEVAVLSTCNRFEIYFASPELKKYAAIESVHAFLRQKSGLAREDLDQYLFTHSGEEATTHLFEVSSGLDSLVLGEAQILAQVKACHEHCIEKVNPDAGVPVEGSGGKIVSKMLNAAIRMGKLARTKTKIGKGSVSVSSAAVELMMMKALRDVKKPAGKVKVCILGAGKMSRLLLLALFSKHPDQEVVVVNRNVANAQACLDEELVKARGGGMASVAGMESMWDVIDKSDVVFAATGAKEPIITKESLASRDRDIMLVDISVPRNMAADCEEAGENVHSYSVDDLKQVIEANAAKRQSEVLKAKRLIDEEVKKFKVWQTSQGAVPYLAALQSMAENIRKQETEKMEKKLGKLSDKEKEAVDKLTKHIVDQIFRPIYYSMKENEGVDAKKNKIAALKSMFNLEPEYKRRLLKGGPQVKELNAAPAQELNAAPPAPSGVRVTY